ncbi:hypothetical protein [Robinsoniella sp. KNHs210]|uniref:hypothetical protein n=1 Tax=Robinsoniella sp. KNHs210 TaxID=1469950 RepID=UPI00048962AF|nr:hypothetical protein [Robinsoniella sp. KNHs210]
MVKLSQEEVRERYIQRLIREKQIYISEVTGIPSTVLSNFKRGLDLWESSLEVLNSYLNGELD